VAGPLRYIYTLRYLRPRQLWFQVWRRLKRPRPDMAPPPSLREGQAGKWLMPARREPSLSGPSLMTYLGIAGELDELGWSGSGAQLLWRYNQHYFDDLLARGAPSRSAWHKDLIARWLAENPPGSRPGWDPYPMSLRLVNWCKWLLSGADPVPGMIASMAVQCRFLARSLEFHVLGNHLLSNAKALTFVGTLFAGAEADRWFSTGVRLLVRELREQVLADGGNFERSPMYHALCLEDVLDLANLAAARPERFGPAPAKEWRDLAAGMQYWLETMCHPDGQISHFNDAAIGIAPEPSELARYARALGVAPYPASGVEQIAGGIVWLRESGYVRAEAGGAVLLCDLAPLGPDYLPAHGHADTLSFELSLKGQRVIVNGGTSRYGESPERMAERGTKAHSTVSVMDFDSSEVWGGFRVARRARPFDISMGVSKGEAMIAASHNGYQRLRGRPIHRRAWRLTTHSLTVADDVSPTCPAEARFIAHPEISLTPINEDTFQIGPATLEVQTGVARPIEAFHSARFNEKRPTKAVCVSLAAGRSHVKLSW
jgi:uncharacterized heparinase superfamily protein